MTNYLPISIQQLTNRLILLSSACFFITAGLHAQDTDTAVPTSSLNLFDLIKQGGWAMWPLGLCSLFMLFLIFYSWKETSRKKFIPDTLVETLSNLLQARQVEEAKQTLQGDKTVLSRSLQPALNKARPAQPDANKEKVESTLVDMLEAEESSITQWVNYLNVVAAVSPMIGLLGTVSGMISAFQTISMGGMGRPELLAGDIGEALITTATGLVIGIPAMIAYFILKNRVNSMMVVTVQVASQLIDSLTEEPNQSE